MTFFEGYHYDGENWVHGDGDEDTAEVRQLKLVSNLYAQSIGKPMPFPEAEPDYVEDEYEEPTAEWESLETPEARDRLLAKMVSDDDGPWTRQS
jgi:hypothetical protein